MNLAASNLNNLPYVGGIATSRTTSSPSLYFGYITL